MAATSNNPTLVSAQTHDRIPVVMNPATQDLTLVIPSENPQPVIRQPSPPEQRQQQQQPVMGRLDGTADNKPEHVKDPNLISSPDVNAGEETATSECVENTGGVNTGGVPDKRPKKRGFKARVKRFYGRMRFARK